MNDLGSLRAELQKVDREILERVARRQELALAIGKVKALAGIPTRDFARERDVLERSAAEARSLGLAPDLAHRLALFLIDASLTAQEQDRVAKEGSGEGKRALVIGGAGRMGRWMADFLDSQGFTVEIADPAGPVAGFRHHTDWRACGLDQDVIVLAPTLRVTGGVLLELAQAPPPGLVFDIGSLKTPLREPLRRLARAGGRVTSVHPMFGPDTQLLSGRHIVFVDLGVPEATRAARDLFASTMAVQVEMDLDSHDRMIAYVLGLSHAVNITFMAALTGSGEPAARLAALSSTTFGRQMELARAVSTENPRLYYEIQSLNAYGGDALDALAASAARVRDVVATGDEAAFVDLMETGRSYLAEVGTAGGEARGRNEVGGV